MVRIAHPTGRVPISRVPDKAGQALRTAHHHIHKKFDKLFQLLN
jgi:hypothetical protein